MLNIMFINIWLNDWNQNSSRHKTAHDKECLLVLFQDDNIPQEVKVDGGELGLNQSPETPEEMRRLDTEGREWTTGRHNGLACTCCLKVNVVSNYPTQLTWACTKPAVALWLHSWHRNTIASLAHPPHCPLFHLTVNKAECISGESAESHKGYNDNYKSASCMLATLSTS